MTGSTIEGAVWGRSWLPAARWTPSVPFLRDEICFCDFHWEARLYKIRKEEQLNKVDLRVELKG